MPGCHESTSRAGGSHASTRPHGKRSPSSRTSYTPPPTRGSITHSRTRSALIECVASGHHRAIPLVNTENACDKSHATVIDFRTGSRYDASLSTTTARSFLG